MSASALETSSPRPAPRGVSRALPGSSSGFLVPKSQLPEHPCRACVPSLTPTPPQRRSQAVPSLLPWPEVTPTPHAPPPCTTPILALGTPRGPVWLPGGSPPSLPAPSTASCWPSLSLRQGARQGNVYSANMWLFITSLLEVTGLKHTARDKTRPNQTPHSITVWKLCAFPDL